MPDEVENQGTPRPVVRQDLLFTHVDPTPSRVGPWVEKIVVNLIGSGVFAIITSGILESVGQNVQWVERNINSFGPQFAVIQVDQISASIGTDNAILWAIFFVVGMAANHPRG